MSLKENQSEAIETLAKNEEVISRLYKAYAKKFPYSKSFWSKLAEDELEHAKWIRRLHSGVKEDEVYFKEGRFRKKAIQSFSNYVNERLASVRTIEITLINALSIALDIENGLIESEFFKVFRADPKPLKYVLKNLAAATRKHRNILRKAWEKQRHSD